MGIGVATPFIDDTSKFPANGTARSSFVNSIPDPCTAGNETCDATSSLVHSFIDSIVIVGLIHPVEKGVCSGSESFEYEATSPSVGRSEEASLKRLGEVILCKAFLGSVYGSIR